LKKDRLNGKRGLTKKSKVVKSSVLAAALPVNGK
jgi:hypothetical protein